MLRQGRSVRRSKLKILFYVLPYLPEASADLAHESLRLFKCGKMSALVELVEVEQFRISLLRHSARRAENLFGENGTTRGYRNRIGRNRSEALPVEARRRC